MQHGLMVYDYGARTYDPAGGRFWTMDPLAEKYPWLSPYAYCGNNPVKYVDPTGMFIESAWDIFSLGLGINSFIDNIKEGKIDAAIADGVGIITDAAAVALPLVPGGAGTAIKGIRVADKAVDAIRAGSKIDNATDATRAIKTFDGQISTGSKTNKEAFGKAKENNRTTETIKTRQSEGKDGATSKHIIETDYKRNTVSKTHQVVNKNGKVIHQHQDFVNQNKPKGEPAKTRQFPDDWIKYPN
jgi:RHS repeat-associated protein